MNARLVFCIAMGVFTAHIGLVMLLSHLRPQPKAHPRPKENFSSKAASFTDAGTGEKMVYREFTVSTRLVPSESTLPPAKTWRAGEAPAPANGVPKPE